MILIDRRKLFLSVFFILSFIFSVMGTSDDISIKYHNRFSKPSPEHRPIHHPVSVRPTSIGHTSGSSPITPYRHTAPPTRSFYKSLMNTDTRKNGSVSDISEVPVMRWKQPPNRNPWYTLYRPSAAPHYNHQTKKPAEPSWKPAHMMLEEAPKVPFSRIQETNMKYQSPPPPKDYYKHMYGTQEGIKYLKGVYGPSNLSEVKSQMGITQDLEDVRLANEHFLRMRSSARCKVPAPEVVCVKDIYPNPTKEYLPRCTLLHRCGDRSGCCESETHKCAPRAIQEVALNFYIVHQDMPASQVALENSVEKLLFTNHTDCECMLSTDPQPNHFMRNQTHTNQETNVHGKKNINEEPIKNEELPLQDNHKELRLNTKNQEEEEVKPENFHTKSKCRECPMPFSLRQYPDGRCTCDCFDKQRPCIKIKRGRESLISHEKRCVEKNACNIPECEYGMFITSTGRCPKKPEDFQKHGKNTNHNSSRSLHNPNHRWIYSERD